jgi:hypothetical protein
MDPGSDAAFGREREDPEADARSLYESLTRNQALVRCLENRARMAGPGRDRYPSFVNAASAPM